MNFISTDFAIFFFIVISVFYFLSQRNRIIWLLLASYFFYGYWSVPYLLLLIFTMAVDYFFALQIEASSTHNRRKKCLILSLSLNLGILFAFKYFNFFSEILGGIVGKSLAHSSLILPFGISFYTFHAMSYVIDVYRRVIPAERNFIYYSSYVMFFPQLVAGPLARASHLLQQFRGPKFLKIENIIEGSWLVMRGYFYKVVLADRLAPAVDLYFSSGTPHSPFRSLQTVYFFAFQIYFDFAGYTDIARGLAKCFDFDLVVNFNRPYTSASITEFWKRWHISLSTWLRDYLYISLGGNRGSQWKTYRNLLLTMLLGGLWHGANLSFVVWGALHGGLLAVERFLMNLKPLEKVRGFVPRLFRVLLCFHLVCFCWIFFRSENISQALGLISSIASLKSQSFNSCIGEVNSHLWVYILLAFGFEWAETRIQLIDKYRSLSWTPRIAIWYSAILGLFLFAEVNPKSFIYFQF